MDLPSGVEAVFCGEATDQQDSMIFPAGPLRLRILEFVILVVPVQSASNQPFVSVERDNSLFGAACACSLISQAAVWRSVMGGIGGDWLAGIVVNITSS